MIKDDESLSEPQEGEFLLAFGPADHHYESDEDDDEACSYVLGYN